jgi:hypothetical protein
MLVSQSSVLHQIERWLERFKSEGPGGSLTLRVHPLLHEPLTHGLFSPWRKMKMRTHVRAKIVNDDLLRGDEFRFIDSAGKDVTPEFLGQKPVPEVIESVSQNGVTPRRKENRYNDRGKGGGNRNNQRRSNRTRPANREGRR